jgi:hypothetical protein
MVAYTARLSVAHIDPVAIGAYWSERVETMLRACVRDRDLLPPERTIDIRFDQFMADDLATVQEIYALAGEPMTPGRRADIDAYLAGHPRGRYGTITYDPAALGLDPEERRRALAFYRDRFDLPWEGP